MPAVQLITPSEYARRRGCSEAAVRKAIAKKRITAFERDGKKLIDPVVADIQWAANTRARVRSQRPEQERAVIDTLFSEIRDAWFAANETAACKLCGLADVRQVQLALDDEARAALARCEQRLVASLGRNTKAIAPGQTAFGARNLK